MDDMLKKGKLELKLEKDKEKLRQEIQELQQIKESILNSPNYLILDGKTQMVEVNQEKEVGKARSRMEHTNNVALIARDIMEKIWDQMEIGEDIDQEIYELNKQKEILYTEIMGRAHDLGHTPFGHSGELVLNEFVESIEDYDEINVLIAHRRECFGIEYEENQGHIDNFKGRLSFEHNEQSALAFEQIIQESGITIEKVDSKRIINGILAHSISRVPEVPKDLAAQIVRQTDKIEYRNIDFEEINKLIKLPTEEQEITQYMQLSTKQRIKKISTGLAREAIKKGRIDDDNETMRVTKKARKQYEHIIYYLDEDGSRGLLTQEYRERNQVIYAKLLQYYYEHPEQIPTKSMTYNDPINPLKTPKRVIGFDSTKSEARTKLERTIQYVNSFTNKKCQNQYLRLVKERIIRGEKFGIKPITPVDIQQRREVQIQEAIQKIRARDMYKSRQVRSDYELWQIVRRKSQQFIEQQITEKGKEKIVQSRKLMSQKEQEDAQLTDEMKNADQKRRLAKIKGEIQTKGKNEYESERIERMKQRSIEDFSYHNKIKPKEPSQSEHGDR